MPLRVCILAHEAVQSWVPFYIEAFRRRCEVVTIGGAIDPDRLGAGGWAEAPAPAVPNDIVTDSVDAVACLGLLPEEWVPDLVVAVQSGEPPFQRTAALNRPTVYISVDTWHDSGEVLAARCYDFVFAAQPVFLPYFKQGGCARAAWLPLGASPALHRAVDADAAWDITFVGTTKYGVNEERLKRLAALGEHFSVEKRADAGPEEMCRVYAAGRLAFNSSVAQDVNMRVFEVLAMGRPLLTNRDAAVNGLLELFEEGTHFIGYDDADLVGQAGRYLADAAACTAMARAGQALVLEKHTYLHRIDALLESVREGVSGLGRFSGPLFREGDCLSAYLPFGARVVVDIGMGLDRSKVALRGHGVVRLVGVAGDREECARRRGSYDEVLTWPAGSEAVAGADALLWTAPARHVADVQAALAYAHGALCAGGALVLRLSVDEMASAGFEPTEKAWDAWAYAQGFHQLLFRPREAGENWHVIVLKKYTRSIKDIYGEIYARFPGGHLGGEA